MSITINNGGVLKTLSEITVNNGGTLYSLNTVSANVGGGVIEEVFSKNTGVTELSKLTGYFYYTYENIEYKLNTTTTYNSSNNTMTFKYTRNYATTSLPNQVMFISDKFLLTNNDTAKITLSVSVQGTSGSGGGGVAIINPEDNSHFAASGASGASYTASSNTYVIFKTLNTGFGYNNVYGSTPTSIIYTITIQIT